MHHIHSQHVLENSIFPLYFCYTVFCHTSYTSLWHSLKCPKHDHYAMYSFIYVAQILPKHFLENSLGFPWKNWLLNPNLRIIALIRIKTMIVTYCTIPDPWWHRFVHLYTVMIPKRKFSQRGWEASWSRSFQSDELEVVSHRWVWILLILTLGLIPMSYLLEMWA